MAPRETTFDAEWTLFLPENCFDHLYSFGIREIPCETTEPSEGGGGGHDYSTCYTAGI